MKNFLFTLLLCCVSVFVFAQGGGAPQTGVPQYDLEVVQKCHDNGSGILTPFYSVVLFTIGNNTPVVTNYAPDGSTYTVPGTGTVSLGSCGGNSQTFDFEIVPRCDDGTVYFTVLRSISDGSTDSFVFSNIGTDGNPYTPVTANPAYGYCAGSGGESRTSVSNTGTIDGSTLTELTIVNVGLTIGTLTIDGVTTDLLPGEHYYDGTVPVTDVGYTATGTTFRIVQTAQ